MNLNWTAVLFFVLAVIMVAQSSITIFTYNKNGTKKDSNYYFSVFVLVVSICGLIASGIMITKPGGGTPAAVAAALDGRGELLPPVDVETLGAKGTPQNVENLMATVEKTASQVKTRVDLEVSMKKRALEALLESVQGRMASASEAAAALGAKAE